MWRDVLINVLSRPIHTARAWLYTAGLKLKFARLSRRPSRTPPWSGLLERVERVLLGLEPKE